MNDTLRNDLAAAHIEAHDRCCEANTQYEDAVEAQDEVSIHGWAEFREETVESLRQVSFQILAEFPDGPTVATVAGVRWTVHVDHNRGLDPDCCVLLRTEPSSDRTKMRIST